MPVGILCDRAWKGYFVTKRKRGTKLHEEKSIQGSIALHTANLFRILIFRDVLWISDAEQGILIFVSNVYEYVYLCGLDGICHSESAVVSI